MVTHDRTNGRKSSEERDKETLDREIALLEQKRQIMLASRPWDYRKWVHYYEKSIDKLKTEGLPRYNKGRGV